MKTLKEILASTTIGLIVGLVAYIGLCLAIPA